MKRNPVITETRFMSTHDKIECARQIAELNAVKCIRSWQLEAGSMDFTRDLNLVFESEGASFHIRYLDKLGEWFASTSHRGQFITRTCKTAQEVIDLIEDEVCDPLELIAHRARRNPKGIR